MKFVFCIFFTVMAIPVIPLTFSYHIPVLNIYWNSWRTLQLIYSAPSLLTAGLLCFIMESPKFAIAKGDEDRTLDILRTIYKRNHWGSREEFPVRTHIVTRSIRHYFYQYDIILIRTAQFLSRNFFGHSCKALLYLPNKTSFVGKVENFLRISSNFLCAGYSFYFYIYR